MEFAEHVTCHCPRHFFEHQPEASALPEACEVEYPQLHRRWGELLPRIRHVAAQAVAACPKPAV